MGYPITIDSIKFVLIWQLDCRSEPKNDMYSIWFYFQSFYSIKVNARRRSWNVTEPNIKSSLEKRLLFWLNEQIKLLEIKAFI